VETIGKLGFIPLSVLVVTLLLANPVKAEVQNREENISSIQHQIKILKQEVTLLQRKISQLEAKIQKREKEKTASNTYSNRLESLLKNYHIGLGISSGYFYASNTGESNNDKFLISNILLTFNYSPKAMPVSLDMGVGGTTTPSLLDNPYDQDSEPDIDIEYADFSIHPIKEIPLTLEAGLLQPNAGYEDTYTFNNKNITVGALASQQPYNAYGARLNYSITNNLSAYYGYYKNRKDKDEYSIAIDGKDLRAKNAWEAGLTGSIYGFDYTLYYYDLNNFRKLLGLAIERNFKNIQTALDVDYWNWDSRLSDYYGSKSSIGGALYISPIFGKFELPVRLEYIHQDKSRIYIDNEDTKNIYTISITPTYNITKTCYLRLEGSYINAKDGFSNDNGKVKNYRYYIASEVGMVFR